MNVVLRPIIKAHENINLTDSGGIWIRVWGLMEKDDTYIVAGVMVGGLPFNCIQTMSIFISQQISSNFTKNDITYKPFT